MFDGFDNKEIRLCYIATLKGCQKLVFIAYEQIYLS